MKLFLSIGLVLLHTVINAQAPTFEWAGSMGGIYQDFADAIAVDANGFVYATGSFIGPADLDPGVNQEIFNTSSYQRSLFVQKLDTDGNLIWAAQTEGNGSTIPSDMAVDVDGNTYIIGSFGGTVDFDGGSGTFNLTNNGILDIFILKLDASGNFVWAIQTGGDALEIPGSITIDANGDVYVGGTFSGTVDFDPGNGVNNFTSAGSNDAFVWKVDKNGNALWAIKIGGARDEGIISLALDASGNVYSTGYFDGSNIDFDPGVGTSFLSSSTYSEAMFIQKLGSDGHFIWAVKAAGLWSSGATITVDASGIYTAGSFRETVDFDPGANVSSLTSTGNEDNYILKLDTDGNFVWVKQLGNNTIQEIDDIAIDNRGNVYTTGEFYYTIDFDPGPGTYYLTANGASQDGAADIFIQILDANGAFVWAQQMGGNTEYDDVGAAIAVDGNNVYAAGNFWGTSDFDAGLGEKYITSNGASDAFILKWGDLITSTVNSTDAIGIKAYPNPNSGQFTLDLGMAISASVTICNAQGVLVKTINDVNQKLSIDLKPGMYVISVKSEGSVENVKVVVE